MVCFAIIAARNQQTCRITWLDRFLGDQFRRQIVVEECGVHGGLSQPICAMIAGL